MASPAALRSAAATASYPPGADALTWAAIVSGAARESRSRSAARECAAPSSVTESPP